MAILVEPVQFDEIVLREFLHDENEFSWKMIYMKVVEDDLRYLQI